MKKLSALFVQDHNRNGGAARAAGRWARLLDREGHIVKQAAGDEAASAGFLLTGKPPRGWQRIVECFAGKKKERKKRLSSGSANCWPRESPTSSGFIILRVDGNGVGRKK